MQNISFFRRIGTKITAVFLVALAPLVAVIAYLNVHMRHDARVQGGNMVFQVAFEAAAAQGKVVAELRGMLRDLAETPAARNLDAPALDRALLRLHNAHDYLSNMFVCDASGNMVASAMKPFSGINASDRLFYTEAMRRGDLAVGRCITGRVTGNPVIAFAQPVRRANGHLAGLAVATVDLRHLSRIFDRLELHPGIFLSMLDSRGALLAQVPPDEHLKPGDLLIDTFREQFSWNHADGSFAAHGPGGVETLYAYRLLRLTPDDAAPYGVILAGMPVSVAMEATRRWLYLSIVVSSGCLLAALALVVWLSRVAIVRRLEVLAGFAASLREEKICCLPPRFGADEIGLLGRQLADMSRELHEKNDRLAETMDTLAQERDRLAVVVGQLSEAREELERLASVDFLTGLHNRRCFSEKMQRERMRLLRYGTPFSLILFDIDDFKKVNDTHGHNVGDDVLRALGRLTAATIRAIDEAYRVGGEEFAVVLPETRGKQAMIVAERLRTGVEKLVVPLSGSDAIGITISLGVVEAWAGARADKDIFAVADDALYAAKHSGKNAIRLAGEPTTA